MVPWNWTLFVPSQGASVSLPCNLPVSLCIDKNSVRDKVSVDNLGIVMTELKTLSKLKQSFLNLESRETVGVG